MKKKKSNSSHHEIFVPSPLFYFKKKCWKGTQIGSDIYGTDQIEKS